MKTKEEIQSLIDGKIKGQGSAIDIGGALPDILGGLNEIANDAVGPNSTDLDEETQMQVRKNLGLYYEEESTQKIEFDAAGTFKRYPGEPGSSTVGWYKSSDAILSKDAVEGQKLKYGEDEIEITAAMCVDGVKGFVIYEDPDASSGPMALIALEDGATLDGASSLAAGVWLFKAGEDTKADWLEYIGTTVSKVPAKYLPDAPEPDEVEGNPTVPGGTSPTPLENLRINDDYFSIPQGGGGSGVNKIEVEDQESLTNEQINSLEVGDIVIGLNGHGSNMYFVVSFKYNTKFELTNMSVGNGDNKLWVEVITYQKSNDDWGTGTTSDYYISMTAS